MKLSSLKLALISVISLSQLLLLVFFLCYKNINVLLGSWAQGANLSIYLKTDTTEAEKNELLGHLNQLETKSEIRAISRQQATEEFTKSLGSYASGLFKEDELIDLVPETIEVIAPTSLSIQQKIDLFQKLTAGLSSFKTVEESVYGLGWLQRFSKLDETIQIVGGISFLILLVSMAFLAALMVRVLVEDAKSEIEVYNLLGATRWSILNIFLKDLAINIFLSLMASLFATFVIFIAVRTQLKQSEFARIFADKVVFLTLPECLIFISITISFIFLVSLKATISALKNLTHLTYE